MIARVLMMVSKNPIVLALAVLGILTLATAGYQTLRAMGLEAKLALANGTVAELRGAVALHHAEAEALTASLGEQTRKVRQWQAEAEKRAQAAALAVQLSENAARNAEERITKLRAGQAEECSAAVREVREILGI